MNYKLEDLMRRMTPEQRDTFYKYYEANPSKGSSMYEQNACTEIPIRPAKPYRHEQVWITKDGSRILITDMTNNHLINTIKFLNRQSLDAYTKKQLELMRIELKRREDIINSEQDPNRRAGLIRDGVVPETVTMKLETRRGVLSPTPWQAADLERLDKSVGPIFDWKDAGKPLRKFQWLRFLKNLFNPRI